MSPRERNQLFLVIIGVFKLLKASLLVAVAIGIHQLLRPDAADVLVRLAHAVRVDPENHIVHGLISKLTGVSHARLQAIRIGTLIYAAMFATEGVGLVLRRRWAEWFTTITTGGLLPVELYEVIHRPHWPQFVVLVLNLLIVLYLIRRLMEPRATSKEPGGGPAIDIGTSQ